MNPKTRVLICDPIDGTGIEKLQQADYEVDIKPSISKQQLRSAVSEYDALVVRSRTEVTREIIEAGEKLKAIGRAGVGLDNIDLETAEERGVTVLNTPEAPAQAVAELTIALILCLARNIPLADISLKGGEWIKKELMGWQLKGKTIGIIGLGHIGENVAKIAKAFEMKIAVTKRTPPPQDLLSTTKAEYIPIKDFARFLRKSDVVTIHIPLTPQTRHMIGTEEIRHMRDGAFLVNTSRGGIVDEEALLEALQSGKLGGAALDVYEDEPPKNLDLIKLPNVICTPHIGGQTLESQKAASAMIAKKLIKELSTTQTEARAHAVP